MLAWIEQNVETTVIIVQFFVLTTLSTLNLTSAKKLYNDSKNSEKGKQYKKSQTVAAALASEIHSNVSRCVLDGITWSENYGNPSIPRDRSDTQKFMPFTPVIYRGLIIDITNFPPKAASKIIRFYDHMDAIGRQVIDLKDSPENIENDNGNLCPSTHLTHKETLIITARFHQALEPGIEALKELFKFIDDSKKIEQLLREADSRYLEDGQVSAKISGVTEKTLFEIAGQRIAYFQTDPQLSKYAVKM